MFVYKCSIALKLLKKTHDEWKILNAYNFLQITTRFQNRWWYPVTK